MKIPNIFSKKDSIPNQGQPVLRNKPAEKKEEVPIFELVENQKVRERVFLENQNAKPEVVENRRKELDGLKERITGEKEKIKQARIKETLGADHQYNTLLSVKNQLEAEIQSLPKGQEKKKKEAILLQTNVDIGKIESVEIEKILAKNFGGKSHFGILRKETQEAKAVFEKSKKPLDRKAWENKDLQKEQEKGELFDWLLVQENKESVLSSRLEKTREAYAKDDYDKGEKFRKLKKLLGTSLKTTPDQLAELQKRRIDYEETAKGLTTAKLEGIKRRHMGADMDKKEMGQEIKDLLVEVDLKEKMNLIKARTEAINEKWKVKEGDDKKERWKKNIRNGAKGSLQWYRDLSPQQKRVISATLFVAGFGAGALGATGVAAAVGATKLSWRFFSSLSTGVGLAGLQKNIREKRDTEKVEKETAAIMNEMQAMPWEEKFDSLTLHLEKTIDGYEKSFRREKRKNVSRKVIGFGSAAAMFFVPTMVREHFWGGGGLHEVAGGKKGIFSSKMAWAKEPDLAESAGGRNGKTSLSDALRDKLSEKKSFGLDDQGGSRLSGAQSFADDLSDKATEGASGGKLGEKIINSREVFSIPKDGNIEKALIGQYLKDGKDLKLAQGDAHRDVLDWIKSHPELGNEKEALAKMKLVQPGTKIIFDEKNGKILGFEDPKGKALFGSLPDYDGEKESQQIIDDAKKEVEGKEVGGQPPEMDPNNPENDSRNFGEETKKAGTETKGTISPEEETPSQQQKEAPKISDQDGKVESAGQAQPKERGWADKVKDRLIPNEEIVSKIIPSEKDFKIADNFLVGHQGALWELKMFDRDNPSFPAKRNEVLSSFFKDLYGGAVEKADVDNMQRFLVHNQDARFGSIYRGFLKEFGKEIIPEKDETMAEWSKRLAILVLDKKIKVQA